MKNKHAQALGKRGGKATVERHGNEYMKALSKKAVEARKSKKATGSILPVDIERSV